MKTGQRKLCDIHCHLPKAVDMRLDLEHLLERQKIPYEVSSNRGKDDGDFWRYAVRVGDLRRARALLPLTLRDRGVLALGGGR
jgi:hypothetical protein